LSVNINHSELTVMGVPEGEEKEKDTEKII
jgi:hypothetical protein